MTVNIKVINLTPKQKEILNYVQSYIQEKGYAPSIPEIANKFDKAISTIHKHLELIQKKGFLIKDENQSRSITPVERSTNLLQIPLLGVVSAGRPVEPLEIKEMIEVPSSLISGSGNFFALKVLGDSMIDDDVWSGDLILIKQQNVANVGDMIVATSDGETTLKRYGGLVNNKIKLVPKNPTMNPFFVDKDTFEIKGIFAGLIRRGI